LRVIQGKGGRLIGKATKKTCSVEGRLAFEQWEGPDQVEKGLFVRNPRRGGGGGATMGRMGEEGGFSFTRGEDAFFCVKEHRLPCSPHGKRNRAGERRLPETSDRMEMTSGGKGLIAPSQEKGGFCDAMTGPGAKRQLGGGKSKSKTHRPPNLSTIHRK